MTDSYTRRRDATLDAVVPPSQTMRDEIGFRAWWAMWSESCELFTGGRRVGVIRGRFRKPFDLV